MDKKIGNYLIVLVSICTIISTYASLDVFITDMQSNRLAQVEVEVPFLVRIVAKNIDTDQIPQGLKSWQSFSFQFYGKEQSFSSINGKSSQSTTFNFVLKASAKGTFRCPGLTLQDKKGQTYQSADITIVVADDATIVQARAVAQPFILVPEINQKNFYIGQKVILKMRFGYQQEFEDLQIQTPQMSDFSVGYMSNQPTSGTIKNDNNQYDTHDFIMELYPTKLGTIAIPAFQAFFTTNRFNFASMMTSALLFMGKDSVSSVSKSIVVQPLPKSDEFENVSAIGTFDLVEIKLSTHQAKVGEGIVLTMTVQGSGNLAVVHAPVLELPSGLHAYEGNSKLIRISETMDQKEYEWIVQADQPGDFIIPVQSFNYFDPITRKYNRLQTTELSLQVTGQAVIPSVQQTKETKSSSMVNVDNQIEHKNDRVEHKAAFTNLLYDHNRLPAKIGYLIIVLLLLMCGLFFVIHLLSVLRHKIFWIQIIPIKFAFFKACYKAQILLIYNLFETMLAEYDLPLEGYELEDRFKQLKMNDSSYQNWRNFVGMLYQINFADAKDQFHDQEQVKLAISLAKEWFPVIVSCCKISFKIKMNQNSKYIVR